ncbi:hypothetical protein B0T24DRAFT_620140 [Lasiosphaeria ovina]|uniref:Uncharacterized protein n=1 Tax=Lasiosphaeria ovina TaxID=92902 RepID=A0AAE0KI03_9PEZI|nr:hypothetical protein B0T24DRAFT_620140 [Lasiosphaeria ovina]
MSDDPQLPLALRRSRRSSLGPLRLAQTAAEKSLPTPESSAASTPNKKSGRPKKRVRFSDPGPLLAGNEDELSTGLTPMIRRTTLSAKPFRRHSTSPRISHSGSGGLFSGGGGLFSGSGADHQPSSPLPLPVSGEVHLLPLRQVLDGRVKRRIRRNGLSEEMNSIYAERKRKAQDTQAEIGRLRNELAARDDEIHRLHDETIEVDTERVWELERQVEDLKRQLAAQSSTAAAAAAAMVPSSPAFEWTVAARDPFSDDFMDVDATEPHDYDDDDEDAFGATTIADLACSTPTRRSSNKTRNTSFPTPPTTSPAAAAETAVQTIPDTPCSSRRRLDLAGSTPRSITSTGVQATLPDLEKQQLEDELAGLQLEMCKLTTALEAYAALTAGLADKLAPFSATQQTASSSLGLADGNVDNTTTNNSSNTTSSNAAHSDLDARLTSVLQTLSDRTAALSEVNSSLHSLGFAGSDALDIISSIASSLRSARLELEYATPGEVALPLTSAGAAVLDLLLARLRELARRAREADDSIDEYHALEQSLRQQLGTRVDAMDSLSARLGAAEMAAAGKDARLAELEVGIDRLRGAVGRYERDVAELEALAQRMDGELAAAKQGGEALRKDQAEAVEELEVQLVAARRQTAAVRGELAAVEARHASELAGANKAHGAGLALRDARVAELRVEVDRVNASLRTAHDTVAQLRVEVAQLGNVNAALVGENKELAARVEGDRRRARGVIDSMKAEIERVARTSEGLLATPKSSGSKQRAGRLLLSSAASSSGGRDSGIGAEEQEDGVGLVGSVTTPAGVKVGGGVGLFSGELAKKSTKSRKRRRYDSGLGFLDEEEMEGDVSMV